MRNQIQSRVILAVTCWSVMGLGGCQINLVTPYDDTFDQEVTTTQKDVDALMSKIADDPRQPYSSFKDDYAKIRTDLDALKVRAGSHTNNSDTVASVARVQHTFSEFQTEHAGVTATTPLNTTHVETELDIMNTEFKILMGQELAKKSGQKQGTSP